MGMARSWHCAALALLTAAMPLAAQGDPAPAPGIPDTAAAETLEIVPDNTARLTVPVSIGGRGPYAFIVDTGAERTAISRELARELALAPGRTAILHSMTEARRVETVLLPGLVVGQRRIADIHAPALSQSHLGAVGLLGVDSLQSQRVEFDFARQEMTISPSRRREERWSGDTIVITARSRLGRLILVDASVDGQRVQVVVDTGAQFTLGNSALRRRLERRSRLGPVRQIEMLSVTGGIFTADATVARQVQIGGIDIRDLPIAFSDVHVFRQLGLADRPAILLGMDALQLFDRVSVDFANRRVRVMMPESSRFEGETQLAALQR